MINEKDNNEITSDELYEHFLKSQDGTKFQIRIRRLTPKECWRLMGFSDEDFDKAKQVNSDTQLYKQAGNSIVVDVLMAIFKEML